ncbi:MULTISPECIES: hypothetical protein [unclassified Arenibacter]|jgi:hypothetical protein|uniref:hypothetical protein n=1 Tax=unclassified Arenibacter TaxID=2615047 RepID=UPI000E342423|nr:MULTISPECIES: hypothetical protein [unclassified Arenibacter]MCM4162283.1 hypothetical protein [Arenibacter sp. A80]RFT57886.1 hypothetical protein D0S24_01610 [Arenibacter sp. P308M17]
MKSILKLCLALILFIAVSCTTKNEFVIANESVARVVKISNDGHLFTSEILNKISGKKLIPRDKEEFRLRISPGTHIEGLDVVLSSEDFKFIKVLQEDSTSLGFLLENREHQLEVEVHYELEKDDFYIHKYLNIKSAKPVTLERIDMESLSLGDLYQPYRIKQITAQGVAQWRPGLGQPLYGSESATFFGTEFPAADNYVENKKGYCGYLWGREIKPDEVYTSHKAVIGVGDNPEYIQDTFFNYIDRIRIRPLRLQIQYNSWFDFYNGVDKEKFNQSVSKVHQELVSERNVDPLSTYVIDDGWQDVNADWSQKAWQVNSKFDANFSSSIKSVELAGSKLGLWMSPGCLFGAQTVVQNYKEQGFETLGKWMSMAGPKYMRLLEDRILELTKSGVNYFKLDGVFGHLNTREFELNGNKYGMPYMPQLGTEGLSASDPLLNSSKYDELKTYYLVAGTERLMELFKNQHQLDPNVYVVISNGAYLSPWWLMYIDAVWMINAGDAAEGSNRTQELVYRDGVYYDTWQVEHTQFPINSVFNHEPKKVKTGESSEEFSEYLWMNLSRGTGFIELYIKTQKLSESDWDVLAKGLKWAKKVFPYFKRAKMHGGNPKQSEVYGYTGWNEDGGYISFHNPSDQPTSYTITLDRKLGLILGKDLYKVSSPLENAEEFKSRVYAYGSELTINLNPGEVKVLNFH